MEVGMAFWPAKVLLSAIELGLFTTLGAKAMTGSELQGALGLHSRANPDFFDTLVALHFLERDGDGPGGRYRNTAETAAFLDRGSPQFMGGFLEMANARLYHYWGDLTDGLKTGAPQNELKRGGWRQIRRRTSHVRMPLGDEHRQQAGGAANIAQRAVAGEIKLLGERRQCAGHAQLVRRAAENGLL